MEIKKLRNSILSFAFILGSAITLIPKEIKADTRPEDLTDYTFTWNNNFNGLEPDEITLWFNFECNGENYGKISISVDQGDIDIYYGNYNHIYDYYYTWMEEEYKTITFLDNQISNYDFNYLLRYGTLTAPIITTASITYISSYDISNVPNYKDVNTPYNLQNNDLPTLSAYGYKFLGWYYENNYVNKANIGDVVSQGITLFAKWEEVNYGEIQYSTQYGTQPDYKEIEIPYTLTSADLPILTYEGYEFLGWYDGDVKVNVGDTINNNIQLTAEWKQQALIEYYSQYGSVPFDKYVNVPYILKSDDLPTLTFTNHTFSGWFNGDVKINVGDYVLENIQLEALWDKILVNIIIENEYINYYYEYNTFSGSVITINDLPNTDNIIETNNNNYLRFNKWIIEETNEELIVPYDITNNYDTLHLIAVYDLISVPEHDEERVISLFGQIFETITPILEIEIFPNIKLSTFLFFPLVIGLIVLLIKIAG